MNKTTTTTFKTPQAAVAAIYAECQSWRWTTQILEERTGKRFDRALLNRVARGKQAAPNSLRVALGFPVLVPVTACSACGEPHIRKTCPKSHKSGPTRRRPTWRDVRAAYLDGALGERVIVRGMLTAVQSAHEAGSTTFDTLAFLLDQLDKASP